LNRALTLPLAVLTLTFMAPDVLAGGSAASAKKRDVEDRAKRIERLLTVPCCYKGTLEDHNSGLAVKMRLEIRSMLRGGKSPKQILAHYKKKYGQAVLVTPPKGGLSSFLLYGVPFGLAFIGLLVMTVLMTRGRAPKEGPEQRLPKDFKIPPELDKRIDALVAGTTPSSGNPPGRPSGSPSAAGAGG
jgi:cytochrome c-type biogenesis protein CcmH/NrfF